MGVELWGASYEVRAVGSELWRGSSYGEREGRGKKRRGDGEEQSSRTERQGVLEWVAVVVIRRGNSVGGPLIEKQSRPRSVIGSAEGSFPPAIFCPGSRAPEEDRRRSMPAGKKTQAKCPPAFRWPKPAPATRTKRRHGGESPPFGLQSLTLRHLRRLARWGGNPPSHTLPPEKNRP